MVEESRREFAVADREKASPAAGGASGTDAGGISADNGGEPKGESPRAARWAPPRAERNLDSQGASREASPSAHAVGGRTPAGYMAVGSGTRRTPGVHGAAREAPQSARRDPDTNVPARERATIAHAVDGKNTSHNYAVG